MKTLSRVFWVALLWAVPTIGLADIQGDTPAEANDKTFDLSALEAFLPAELAGYTASEVHHSGWDSTGLGATTPAEMVTRTFTRQTADSQLVTLTVSFVSSQVLRPAFDLLFVPIDSAVVKPNKEIRDVTVRDQPARLVVKTNEDGSVEKIVLLAELKGGVLAAVKATGPATADEVLALAEKIDFAGAVEAMR
ncbi:MAG TPA: hypothetical protein PK186_12400 [candidate division Zixibacteria bacterium]|nr:hypothetical protein [candidate division Zixibacteria bacterium]MDD4918317.1 hypothetical protein [candidate division Zixibacteria bacterium]MDM7974023.1 hypothetical protein [candidate division Zixibacteria bacterium]HPM38348.1 hypothetical protein [candidate division Zixibacteria bacterium]